MENHNQSTGFAHQLTGDRTSNDEQRQLIDGKVNCTVLEKEAFALLPKAELVSSPDSSRKESLMDGNCSSNYQYQEVCFQEHLVAERDWILNFFKTKHSPEWAP